MPMRELLMRHAARAAQTVALCVSTIIARDHLLVTLASLPPVSKLLHCMSHCDPRLDAHRSP
jgi:hypothetical protein